MLKPLEQFFCDRCDGLIDKPKDGYFEWLSPLEGKAHSFHIVHAGHASPRRSKGHGDCFHHTDHYDRSDLDLEHFLGTTGLVELLSMIDVGQRHDPQNKRGVGFKDNREFAEIFRRLQLPYYEEARRYWAAARSDGFFDEANEIWIYLPETLKNLIERYGDD